jgi:ribonucleoside-diphosphate reductase beta chain
MTEADVAREVELAGLKQMSDMDIDNVYTLMDVQLRERPDPRTLYRRWEKQNWSAYDIDFSEDVGHWQNLPEELKREITYGLHAFFLGEVAVTDTLSPMVHAAPTDEDRQFLSTQLVDEARHAIFFERFFRDVLGVDGLQAARTGAGGVSPEFYLNPEQRGYGKLFYTDLPSVTDAVRLDPSDYGKWLDSIVLYHMLIEGVLALYGQRQLLRAARLFGILPGFRAGFTAVTRDESRHVNYGVYALRKGYEAGYGERLGMTCLRYLDGPCDLLTRPLEKIVLPPEEILQMVPAELREESFWEAWQFPMTQLRKRLRAGGIDAATLDGLEDFWWTRIDENMADYEARYGEPHPAMLEETPGRPQAESGAA